MFNKIYCGIVFFLSMFPLLCLAEPCPSPINLSVGNYNNWQVLDINNATELSDEDKQIFQNKVYQFALAEWQANAPEGSAHCYYYGKKKDSNYLGAYLVKDDLIPGESEYWKHVTEDVMQCSKELGLCLFQTS